jgi:hypothetical protein
VVGELGDGVLRMVVKVDSFEERLTFGLAGGMVE